MGKIRETRLSKISNKVVQLYINDKVASITRLVKELKGFERVHLDPDEEKKVIFELPFDLFAFYDSKIRLVVEPCEFEIMVGSSSENIKLKEALELRSNLRIGKKKQKFFSTVKIE